MTTLTQAVRETLDKASRVFEQTATRKTAARKSKTKPKTATPKLYS